MTPDSFSDGGSHYVNNCLSVDKALWRAEEMLKEGAAIIDVGGESTRPGAQPLSEEEELDRVLPVIQAITKNMDVVVSVDTSTAAVIREAASEGAGLINDVRALSRNGAMEAAAGTKLPICLMHMRGEPATMQSNPVYENVLTDVHHFFSERIDACQRNGISRERLVIDPGFGFGKTLAHNLTLMQNLSDFTDFGLPLMVGLSRKSMLSQLLNRAVDERLAGSLALAMLSAQRGAVIIRAHDVAATVDVLKVLAAVDD